MYCPHLTAHPPGTPRFAGWRRPLPPLCLLLAALLSLPLPAAESVAEAAALAAVPEARSVDLDQPVSQEQLLESATTQRSSRSQAPAAESDELSPPVAPQNKSAYGAPLPDLDLPATLLLLGARVPPATATRLAWSPSQSFEGIAVPTPVLVVNGASNGPTLCLTAAIHGDELNGIEIVRRVLYNLDPGELSGSVIGVPIVNLQAFRNGSRYLADRRDLNRHFPGRPTGSSAARIAHSFMNDVVKHCDALVDLHTGSFHRTNLPQLRADLRDPAIIELTRGFGSTVVLHDEPTLGTLRHAATASGVPTVTLEAGAPMRLDEESVEQGVTGIETLLGHLKMMKRSRLWRNPEPVYYESDWVRVDQGGILFSNVSVGQKVDPGELLGTVTDPITNVREDIRSPHAGRILGMALNQVVLPGFAAYRIGIQTSDEPEQLRDEGQQALDEDIADNDQALPEDDDLAE